MTDYGALPGIVEQTQKLVGDNGLNLLINNAAILNRVTIDNVTPEDMRRHFEVNSIAPLMIVKVSVYMVVTLLFTNTKLNPLVLHISKY